MLDDELHFLLLRAFNHSNRRIDAAIRGIGLLLGCAILALGICMEVSPKLIMVPGGRHGERILHREQGEVRHDQGLLRRFTAGAATGRPRRTCAR